MLFTQPVRRILNERDLEIWKTSQTHADIVSFVTELAHSVKGLKVSDDIAISPHVGTILELLDKIAEIVHRHPVVKDREISRFGKPEFRDFYDDLQNSEEELFSSFSTTADIPRESYIELFTYAKESWGNRTRIDYGSGHELNFMCFLICLNKLDYFSNEDHPALVLRVFKKYMRIMRLLQTEYWLEPAGSHGVWGLDDYHFLPFLFGASQLSTHEYLKPKSIHNKEVVEEFCTDYLYFECISFINNVKTESLRWHSPMLDDISAVKSWRKVEEGMFKMFQGEVLDKLPIIQHFMFGSLLPCPDGVTAEQHNGNDGHGNGHDHSHNEPGIGEIHAHFGDCCGIKVPAAFGAHKSQKILPFD